GERYVIAQLPQELALVAGEAFRFSARSEQHAEDSALGEERRDHQGAPPCIHETLRKLAGGARDVRLVDELPSDACRQAVAVDADVLVLLHRELFGHGVAARADTGDGQHALRLDVEADAAEVDRQIRLQAADHDLEDAAQIVTLADRASDPMQQVEATQLQ